MTTGRLMTKKKEATEYLTKTSANPWLRNKLIQDPEVNSNSRVLILAPHYLDEVIGCGGTMCKMAKKGAHLKVIYLTNSSYEGKIGPGCGLAPMSPKEAEESLQKLRCFESEILDLPCLGMHCDKVSISKLLQVIDYYSPDLIFIPTLQEKHPDNVMTGLLAAHALKKYDGCLSLYSYEVWGGLFPNTMVEITSEMEDKISAMKVRQEKVNLVDEEKRMKEANTFRLSTMQPERYCEPFLMQEKEEFVTIAKFRREIKV